LRKSEYGGKLRGRQRTSAVGPKAAAGHKWRKGKGKRKMFLFIFRKYLCEKNNLEIARQFIKATKNILKIPKIP
jgi:hypothetical protein